MVRHFKTYRMHTSILLLFISLRLRLLNFKGLVNVVLKEIKAISYFLIFLINTCVHTVGFKNVKRLIDHVEIIDNRLVE